MVGINKQEEFVRLSGKKIDGLAGDVIYHYKIALIQMQCGYLDIANNVKKAVRFIQKAAENGARLICLPEAFATGYQAERMEELLPLVGVSDNYAVEVFKKLASKLKVFVLVPLFIKSINGIENSAFLIDDYGNIVGKYSKTHLIGREKETIVRGDGFEVWDTKIGKIGCLICYDICFPETARILAMRGVEILLVPAAWRKSLYFSEWWDLNIACRALDNLIYVAGINQVGMTGDEFFAGKSKLCSPVGHILVEGSSEKEEILYGSIDLQSIGQERVINTVLEDMQLDLYTIQKER